MTRAQPTGLEPVTPVKLQAVSATERASFRRCHRQWFLTIAHRLDPAEGNQNFWLGELVHTSLQAYYEGQRDGLSHMDRVGPAMDAFERATTEALGVVAQDLGFLWPYARDHWYDLADLARQMLQGYYYREQYEPLVTSVVEVERRRFIPIRSASGRRVGTLTVRTDLVGYRGKRLAVIDHKTASQRMPSAMLDIDDQLTAEAYAVYRDLGVFPEEAVYNALLKKVPGPPRELKPDKDGNPKLSKDKDQLTTSRLYIDEVRRLGLNVTDYSDIIETLRAREAADETPFWYREATFRTPGQIKAFEANLLAEWRDMVAVAKDPLRAYPNPSMFACPSCSVREICTGLMDGSDLEGLIQSNYSIKDPRY